MICDEPREVVEYEEDVYQEYGKHGEFWVAWVYCKECDCWTQHGLKKD
jgi:hypothetical protein